MPIEWNDSYDIGDVQINHQHRRLFVLANQVLRARDGVELLECVAHLSEYIDEHFAYEEALMRRANFPEYDAHVQSHQRLKERLHAFGDQDAGSLGYKLELEKLVSHWALFHIPREDARLADYLNYGDTRKADLSID